MRKLLQLVRFVRVAIAARRVQDFLWNRPGERVYMNERFKWDSWMEQIEKRTQRLNRVDPSHMHWRVEAKKRLLQLSALSVAMMEAIDSGAIEPPKVDRLEGDKT